MALGLCRHCGSGGIATDAPTCLSCGGNCPNPGFFTRLGVWTSRIVGLLILLVGIAVVVAVSQKGELLVIDIGLLCFGIPLILGGGVLLLRSLIWPYG